MTIHLHNGRWYPILFNPSGSHLTARKDVNPQQYVFCCRQNLTSVVHPVYQWYTCYLEFSIGFNLMQPSEPRYELSSTLLLRVQHMRFVNILYSLCGSLFYYVYNNTKLPPRRFVAYITLG